MQYLILGQYSYITRIINNITKTIIILIAILSTFTIRFVIVLSEKSTQNVHLLYDHHKN